MRQSPGSLFYDTRLIPVRVLGTKVAEKHAPGTAVHVTGDAQALDSRHGAEDIRHIVVYYLDARRALCLGGFHIFILSVAGEQWQTIGFGLEELGFSSFRCTKGVTVFRARTNSAVPRSMRSP